MVNHGESPLNEATFGTTARLHCRVFVTRAVRDKQRNYGGVPMELVLGNKTASTRHRIAVISTTEY